MKKCIIMGNGESLNEMPPALFASMPSFGVNYCPYFPDFYVCVDHEILTQHHARIYHLAERADIAYLAQKEKGSSSLYELPNVKLVTHDRDAFITEKYFSGVSVVYVALKIAYYAGYEEVHLWGVDHSPDWKHYSANYYEGAHAIPSAAKMAGAEYHYAIAQRVYNKAGRVIINHSHPSKLDAIFPRVGKEKNGK